MKIFEVVGLLQSDTYAPGPRYDRRAFDFDLFRARAFVRAKNRHLKDHGLTDNNIFRAIAMAVHEILDDEDLRLDGETRDRVKNHLKDNAAGWIAEYKKLLITK